VGADQCRPAGAEHCTFSDLFSPKTSVPKELSVVENILVAPFTPQFHLMTVVSRLNLSSLDLVLF
jgi:hypothetical protein